MTHAMLAIFTENVNACSKSIVLVSFPSKDANFVERITMHISSSSTSHNQPAFCKPLARAHARFSPKPTPRSDVVNVNLLVITRVSVFVELDIVIHALVTISVPLSAYTLPHVGQGIHTYQSR